MKRTLAKKAGISTSSSVRVRTPIDDNTVVKINRVNGKTGLVEEIGVGKYNSKQGSWEFESSEQAVKRWLEDAFNKPPKSYAINEESFLSYIMTTMMPRKGWLMDWHVGDFVNKDIGKPHKPSWAWTDEDTKKWEAPEERRSSGESADEAYEKMLKEISKNDKKPRKELDPKVAAAVDKIAKEHSFSNQNLLAFWDAILRKDESE